jgi:hypothetical protein
VSVFLTCQAWFNGRKGYECCIPWLRQWCRIDQQLHRIWEILLGYEWWLTSWAVVSHPEGEIVWNPCWFMLQDTNSCGKSKLRKFAGGARDFSAQTNWQRRNEACHVSGSSMGIGTGLPTSSSYLLPPEKTSRRGSGPPRILSSHCHPTQSPFTTSHVCGGLLDVSSPSKSLFLCLLSDEVLTPAAVCLTLSMSQESKLQFAIDRTRNGLAQPLLRTLRVKLLVLVGSLPHGDNWTLSRGQKL